MADRRRILPRLLRLGRRVRAFIFRMPVEQEVDEELEFHLKMSIREYEAAGMSPEEARERALAPFGDLAKVKQALRRLGEEREERMRKRGWWDDLRQDVAFGLRQLRRKPGFALVAVLTLALGIGANTAVFSVVHGVLLSPLPYDEPEELVALWTRYLPSSGLDIPQFALSGPELLDYRESSRAMAGVGAYRPGQVTLAGSRGEPERTSMVFVGRHLLPLLGVRPVLGRGFSEAEHEPGAPPAVMLSHGLWTRRFGADPNVTRRSVTVDGQRAEVIGVMPEDFAFPSGGTEMWIPLRLDEQSPGGRAAHGLRAVGRLTPATTLEAARAELETITAAWYDEFDHHAMGHFIFLRPLREDMVGSARPTLLLLMAAVGLVLLVACGNVANLFLARSERRYREMSVRVALGAGRGRLLRQLLTEGVLIASGGAILGIGLAWWGIPALLAVDPTALPRSEAVGIDLPVLAFTAGLVLVTTLLFGLLPALEAGRRAPGETLATEGRGLAGGGRRSLRRLLVGGEVALSLVVVLAAGLVVRSLMSLHREDPGVEVENLLTFELSLPATRYEGPDEVTRAYRDILERVEALPGVRSASAVSKLPLTGAGGHNDFLPEGEALPPSGVPEYNAQSRVVRPGYFETMGIPVLSGRTLTPEDDATSTPVAVVSEATVRRYWPGDNVVGKRFTFQIGAPEPLYVTIVGVVGDTRASLSSRPDPVLYLPHQQLAVLGGRVNRGLTVVARTGVPPAGVSSGVRRVVRDVDSELPVARLRSMEEVVNVDTARPRLTANLLGAFGLVVLLLAAAGIYGVVSYSVARRSREIGLRMALGAEPRSVLALMVGEGAGPAVVGAAVGLLLALAAGGLVRTVLFQVSPTDPTAVVGVSALLLGVAATASYLPARRATQVDPAITLRTE